MLICQHLSFKEKYQQPSSIFYVHSYQSHINRLITMFSCTWKQKKIKTFNFFSHRWNLLYEASVATLNSINSGVFWSNLNLWTSNLYLYGKFSQLALLFYVSATTYPHNIPLLVSVSLSLDKVLAKNVAYLLFQVITENFK